MSKQTIFLGQTANDRTGDPLRVAFEKVNENFTELYSSLGADSQIPTQATHTGKVLTTNGTTLSWSTVSYTSLTDKPTIPPTYTLPTATTSVLGGVKVDGTTVTITDGVISSVGGSGATNKLVNGLSEVILDANGVIGHNGSFTKTTNNFLASTVATQVVWTSTQNGISGVKLTIQVECDETGGVNYPNWETQVCEAIIAVRGYNSTSEPVMSVYGVTHTSVAPLMTFSVQRNPTTFLIEIVGTRTATASPLGGADLRIYSVETGTND